MNKTNLKYILSLGIIIVFLVPVATSYVLDLEKKRENELIQQRLLEEQRIIKEAEEKAYLMGKFDPAQNNEFVSVPTEYNVSGHTMYIRKEALEAFLKMAETAQKENIDLKIASATRNFDYQKTLWNNKWSGYTLVENKDLSKSIPDGLLRFKKILEYSAVPGASRHHWGSDIDINDANPAYFNKEKGAKEYEWLVKNAGIFGFCQPYNLKDFERSTGYNEEKWHWSYMPISKELTRDYARLIKEEDIGGFMGDEYVIEQDLINDYVLSINKDCI